MTRQHLPVGLILGARVRADGTPTDSLRRRTLHGISLYQTGRVRALILSGDGGLGVSQAQAMAALCMAAGLPERDLLLDPLSKTTEENLRFAVPLLEGLGTRRVVVISDPYHLPRAALVARRLGLDVQSSGPSWRTLSWRLSMRMVLREGAAYVWYLLSGKGR